MERINIVVQYDGVWDGDNKFSNFKLYGILLPLDCLYVNFVAEIKRQVGMGTTIEALEIKYQLKEGYQPLQISNDMSLQFFINLVKSCPDITRYPLCIILENPPNATDPSNSQAIVPLCSPINVYISDDNDDDSDDITFDDIEVISNPLHEEIVVNQVYADNDTLVSVMKNLALKKKFQFKVYRSSSTRYTLICAGSHCDWCLKASSLNKSKFFKVRKFINTHDCSPEERLISQRHASYDLIGSLIKDKLDDPKTTYTPKDIIRDIKKDYGVEVNYMKAWRSKEKALEILRGNPARSYARLPRYLYTLRERNPGSVTKLHKTTENRFMYVYVALYASIKGWEHCRPIVVVDGSFIKSTYAGTLLTACTQNAGGHILPLAYAVVDSENDAAWEWFFECFRETYGIREEMCIVSDRCESILRAAALVYPSVPHCICIFHLWNNIKVKFKGSQKQLGRVFFALAKAYTIVEFDQTMKEVEKIDKRVKEYLLDIGYHRWARAHSLANRAQIMTSNLAESCNSANRHARELPIVPLLEFIFNMVRRWNNENRAEASGTYTHLTKYYNEVLEKNMDASLYMTVVPSSEFMYEVYDNGIKHKVCLQNRTCSCKRFQMDEMPCPHAQAVLSYNSVFSYGYFSSYYTRESLLNAYTEPVYPIEDEAMWNFPVGVSEKVVLPPKGRIRAGRPPKKRRKSSWEKYGKKAKLTCARCGNQGHNKKTCRGRPISS